jgi:hypothetical protein
MVAIGVRGTTVWGGPIDNDHGVIVMSGEATVTAGGELLRKARERCSSRRQTSARDRLAGRQDEARRRLNHLREAVGSTVGGPLGLFYPREASSEPCEGVRARLPAHSTATPKCDLRETSTSPSAANGTAVKKTLVAGSAKPRDQN